MDTPIAGLGILLLLALPGWPLALLLLPDLEGATRAAIVVALSVFVNLGVGAMLALGGLFTRPLLFACSLVVAALPGVAALFVERQRPYRPCARPWRPSGPRPTSC